MRLYAGRFTITRSGLVIALVAVLLLLGVGGFALASSIVWQAPVEGAFTPETGFSLSQGAFVPVADSDIVMQDRFLVALHGAGIAEVTGDFASLSQEPSSIYFDKAFIEPGWTYLVKAPDGRYTKLCMCGTATLGPGGGAYYTQYNVTVAQSVSTRTAPSPTPSPAPTPAPAAAPGTLTVNGTGGRVVLTWTPFDRPNDGYTVYRAKEPGAVGTPITDHPTGAWTFTDTAVTTGQTYYYVVASTVQGSDHVRTSEVSVTVTPERVKRSVWLMVGSTALTVNGFTSSMDVPAQIIGGRTMVPLRAVATGLGADLKWDPTDRKIMLALDSHTVVLWVDRGTAYVDGAAVELDVPPTIVNDRTLVPLRFIATGLGAKLVWNAEIQSITLTLGADPNPSVPTASALTPEQQAATMDPVIWRIFRLRLPSEAYTVPSGNPRVGTGPITNSLIQFYADGTFLWASAVDNKEIRGYWTAADGQMVLLDAQEGLDWRVSIDRDKIWVYNEHTRYVGDLVQ